MAGTFLDLFRGTGAGNTSSARPPSDTAQQSQANVFLGGMNPDMLMAISAGLLTGKTPQEQISNALVGAYNSRVSQREWNKFHARENRTKAWLQEKHPDLLPMLDAGISPGEVVSFAHKRQQEQLKAQGPSRKFQTLPNGEFGYFDENAGSWTSLGAAPKGGSDDAKKYGLNPVYGTDPRTGKTVLGQMSDSGDFKILEVPENFVPSTGTGTVDLGNEIGTIDRRTGQVISRTPKDNRTASRDKELGKTDADAITALPGASSLAKQVNAQVQRLKSDPYLESMLGPWDSRMPNMTTDAARVQGYMDQLAGGAFLQGRQLLKGGGAITDFESKKAEAAFARLNAAQSPQDYKLALDDFNLAVSEGVQKLERQAAAGGYVPQMQPQDGAGDPEIEDLVKMYGGL